MASLTDRNRRPRGLDQLPCPGQVGGALQFVADLVGSADTVEVPRVKLTQISLSALRSQMLLGPVDHPEELAGDLGLARRRGAAPGQFLEDPWVAEAAAGEYHRVGAPL